MNCDAAFDDADADFQRWYFGGSPPESDGWDRHAFQNALHAPCGVREHREADLRESVPRHTDVDERLAA